MPALPPAASTWPRPVYAAEHRRLVPEVMDRPDLDPALHRQALTALRRINRLSRTTASLWGQIAPLARAPHAAPLRVLDVACGGGDVLRGLAALAQRQGCQLEFRGCDFSPTAIAHAAHQDSPPGSPPKTRPLSGHPEFFLHDVLANPLPQADIVTCTLFLHHLEESQAVLLLSRLWQAATRRVIVSDLRRSRVGYWLAHAVGRLVTRSPVVHVDGPLSVAAAWSLPEVERLVAAAGWQRHTLRRTWPQRFLLVGDRE
ncbi:MAG: methyltransferase [Planctomycetaceae bacterium]